jgi:hypothetical protein
LSGPRWPAVYEIRVDSVLEEGWSDWFEGLEIERVGGETIISGTLPDRSSLYGILDKLRDLGLSVVDVSRISWVGGPQES